MSALVYIHGFLSSPASIKAVQTAAWIERHRPAIEFVCPSLTPYPAETQRCLESLLESRLTQPVFLVGSSLGGFWATWAAEKYNLPAVLINPAVAPTTLMMNYLERELCNYHTGASYRLQQQHLDEMRACDVAVRRHANYWVMLQTGDETLDYRDAEKKYAGCKQTIEFGGDHAFQGYDRHLDNMLAFFATFTPKI